jgi:hypothetical protein
MAEIFHCARINTKTSANPTILSFSFAKGLSARALLLWLSYSAPFTVADTVVVPNANAKVPGAGEAAVPFRSSGNRYQEFYFASQFGLAPTDFLQINAIRFRIDEEFPIGTSFNTVAEGISISMSTTSRDFNSSSVTFADNIGAEVVQVLSERDLPLSGSKTSPSSFDVVIPLPTAFLYNRLGGNLLVDIRIRGSSVTPFLDSGIGQLAIDGPADGPIGTKVTGLITAFDFQPVPEPTTLSFLLIGAVCLYLKRTRTALAYLGRSPH